MSEDEDSESKDERWVRAGKTQLYTDDELIEYLADWYSEHGRLPSSTEFKESDKTPSASVYKRRFGSWNDAKKRAIEQENLRTSMNTSVVRTQQVIRNRIEDVRPFLEVEEPFTIKDVDAEGERPFDVLKLMHKNGALKKVDRKRKGGHYIGIWRWKAEEKEELLKWLEEQSMFPCGHRASVFNPEWAEEYACKHCEAEYSRETLERLL